MKTEHSGITLRRWRLQCGLKQSEVANRAHVSQQLISLVETGRKAISAQLASELAAATGGELEFNDLWQPKRRQPGCQRCALVKTLIVAAAIDGQIPPEAASHLIQAGGLSHE